MRSSSKQPKVLIAFPSSSNSRNEKMGGIYRYLRERGLAWEFVIMHEYVRLSRDYLSTLVDEGLDGAIFTALDIPRDVVELMADLRLPVVTISLPIPARPNVAFVLNDNAAQARLAVDEFLRSGRFRTYAYVPLPDPPDWCGTHMRVMAEALSKHGRELVVFAAPAARDREHLIRWIRQLPKPAAVLAACDYRANDVLQAARKARVAIPGDLEVMGIDNDTTLCENSTPTLTSIQRQAARRHSVRILRAEARERRRQVHRLAGVRDLRPRDRRLAGPAGHRLHQPRIRQRHRRPGGRGAS